MTGNDLAYIADQYNKELTIIIKVKDNVKISLNNNIVYWKSNRQITGIFHENYH